jgi:undecaprenyl diphosphate synthase
MMHPKALSMDRPLKASKPKPVTDKDTEAELAKSNSALPLKHVAIIMDGNRRWADQRKLPRLSGHKEGVKSLKRLVRHAGAIGLEYLTVYAFSSENWQRSREEVRYLFELFSNVLRDEFDELSENKVRLRFIGDMSTIPARLKKSFERSMEESKSNTGLNLQVAINYGSRLEITLAAKRIAAEVMDGKLAPSEITEELLNSYLFTGEIPDPEMMIRTGGEMRLSNYLLWQAAYSELYITPILWPDFSPENFDQAIEEYAQRNRRYGGD